MKTKMTTNKMCAIFGNVSQFAGLLPLTEKRPLDTLPFDCKYRLIDFPLSSIVNANINNIFMVFNEGETQSVFDHIGGGKEWNLDALQNRFFIYFYQEFLKKKEQGLPYFDSVIDYLQKSKSEYTVFMGSRMLCNIDLRAVLKIHQDQKNNLTAVYKRIDVQDLGEADAILDLDPQGQAAGYHFVDEHQETTEKVSLGMDIFIAKTSWLMEELAKGQTEDAPTSIQDFLRSKIGEIPTSVYEYTGYLSNIYDVNSYYKANMDMLDSTKFNSLLYSSQKIYTKLKNEVPTYYAAESTVKNSQCATGCVIEGHLENSLISRRSKIKKDAIVNHSIVMANANIEANATVNYAILDKNVVVQSGVTIQGTPEQPVVVKKNQVVTSDIMGGA